MSALFKFLFICCFGKILALVEQSDSTCPHIDPPSNLNMEKLLGRWHLAMSKAQFPDRKCALVNLTAVENNALSGSIHVLVENNRIAINGVIFQYDASQPGKLKMNYSANATSSANETITSYVPKLPLSVENYDVHLWIVGTDYDSYFVGYGCNIKGDAVKQRAEDAYIVTRVPEAPQSVIDQAAQILEDKTGFKRSALHKFDQANCS